VTFRILTFPEAEVPRDLRLQVVALQAQAWGTDGPSGPEPHHDPALYPLSVLLVDGERVLAALDILSKDLMHQGETYAASGLSTVVTDRAERRQGHGTWVVRSARELLEARGIDLGIFTCDRPLRMFYERAGWLHLPGTVLVGGTRESPFPSDRSGFDKVTMATFVSARARANADGFIGSRIELYPGEIDRLW
jgi:GNAT superfamily N-acetyltransferase